MAAKHIFDLTDRSSREKSPARGAGQRSPAPLAWFRRRSMTCLGKATGGLQTTLRL